MSEILMDPTAPLTVASGNLRRRQVVSRLMELSATGAAVLAVAVLGIVVLAVVRRGAAAISWHFITRNPPQAFSFSGNSGGGAGGIAPALVGTIIIVAIATLMAMPVGVLVALYLTEFGERRSARVIRMALDLLNGLPTIVVGLFIFELIVVAQHHQSGFAGSCALAIIMLPLIARATQEVLLLVPSNLREAADALGVSRWRTVRGVILPTAAGGIVTATVLAVARAAGETAPLLLLTSIVPVGLHTNPFQPLDNIPMTIFTASESPDPAGFTRAWGAALILVSVILIANVGARAMLARSRRKMGV